MGLRIKTIWERSRAAVSWWIFCWRWSRLSFASLSTPAAEESRCFSAVTWWAISEVAAFLKLTNADPLVFGELSESVGGWGSGVIRKRVFVQVVIILGYSPV